MIDEKRLLEKIDRMNDTVDSYRQDIRTVAQNLLCEISDYIKEQPKTRQIPCNECQPEYLGENIAIGCKIGKCKCGNIVRSYQKFCDECGTRLEW